MRKPDIIVIEGRAYSRRKILELRPEQIEAWKAAQPRQPALFETRDKCRPKAERTADGRYREPTLLSILHDAGG